MQEVYYKSIHHPFRDCLHTKAELLASNMQCQIFCVMKLADHQDHYMLSRAAITSLPHDIYTTET